MNTLIGRPSNVSMKTPHRYLLCFALVACSSSTTVVYQVLPDAGGTDAGAGVDGSVFASQDPDSGTSGDSGAADTGADVADGAWTDATFDAWAPDASFDSSDQ